MAVRYLSQPTLKINGSDASSALMEDILQITIEESLHQPGMFTLMIRNDYLPGRPDDKMWAYDSIFSIGKSVEIGFTSSTTEAEAFSEEQKSTLLKGEITAIEAHFSSDSQAPVIVRGYDISHRLHRGRFNRSFQNKTDSDIVNQIAGEAGISTGTVSNGGGPYDYIFQENQTNMEFLRERAARVGYELFVQDGKLNFRAAKAGENLELKWLEDLYSFRVRVSSSNQVESVEVRGWDYQQKKAIVSTKNSEQVITSTDFGKGSKTSSAFSGKPSSPKMIVVDRPVFSATEADKIAQAVCDELGGEFVYADAKSDGDPRIQVGKVVKLKEMGKYSGSYYVTETRHLYQERVYTTEFSIRGLRGENKLDRISSAQQLEPGQSLLVGIVSNNQDPKKWGRVRVKFPTLTEEHESNWARVVAIGAGPERGFDCLPEINDEVLVAFEHGDIHRPYVIGGVWNGKDAPPETVDNSVVGGKVRLRTFKTRIGHKQQFVEEDKDSSKVGIYTETKGAHKFAMNDTEKFIETKTTKGHYVRLDDDKQKIEIKTTGGHQVVLDDQGKKIEIKTSGGHTISMDDTGKQILIKTTSGQKITMSDTANNIDMQAVQKISITAPMEIKLTSGPSTVKIAPGGIEMQTPAKISAQATATLDLQSAGTANIKSGSAMSIQSGLSLSMQSGAALSAKSAAAVSIQSGASLSLQSGAAATILAGATASMTAPLIRLNC